MSKSEEIKEMVREKYAQIAEQGTAFNMASCCGMEGGCGVDYSIFADDYSHLDGYLESADLGLGCGIPVEHANITQGKVVLDLGSGAGNDVFVARKLVGEEGEVIGVDMTPKMIELAKANTQKLGFDNVRFRLGEIEDLPLSANRVDIVISNCVLNLVPDKEKAFSEIYRVLRSGGHFCISDVVIKGNLPENIRQAAEMYAGCVSGAISKAEYLGIIHDLGFQNVSVKKEKEIKVPDDILLKYLSPEELENMKASGMGIYSITVYAEKDSCCTPGAGCC